MRQLYCEPADINSSSNLNRFLRVTLPQRIDDFDQVGIFGARVILTHESTNVQEVHTYIPSLSSLYLSWNDGYTEYHEKEPIYNRIPINM